jgi:capsular exopolysaccharide synthesis family protein
MSVTSAAPTNGTGTPSYYGLPPRGTASILDRLRRRKWSFLLTACTTGALVAGLFFILPKTYLATSAVTVTLPDPVVGNLSTLSAKIGDDADLASHLLMLRSPTFLAGVLAQPEVAAAVRRECEASRQGSPLAWVKHQLATYLGTSQSCEQRLGSLTKALDWLNGNLSIGIAGRSRVIDVGYSSVSPETAAIVVNAIANAYVSYKTALKSESRGVAVAWLRTEVNRHAQALHDGEKGVAAYRQEHGLVRGELAPISSEKLSSLSKLLATAEANRADAAARLQELAASPGTTQAVLTSHTISELRFKQAVVLEQIARLTKTWKGGSGVLAQLQSEEAALAAQIELEITRLATSAKQQFASYDREVKSLNRQLEMLAADVGVASGQEAEIAGMVRQNDVERSLYVDLTRKADELETERRVLTGDVQLVNLAYTPYKTWFPKPILFVAGGSILAFAAGSAVALFRDRSDNSLRVTSNLRDDLGIQVLAHIPESKELARRGLARTRGETQVTLREAVRSLYAQCLLISRGSHPKTILVTSSSPGEGKSFVTLSLAGFAAAAGKRVLLIEGDLRRPCLANALSVPGQPGLADVLTGTMSLEDVRRSKVQGTLDVIVAGRATLSSTELLCTNRVDELLASATKQYDLVLIDSPPTLMLMDARVLASRVDGVLYCARWGLSKTTAVQDGIAGILEAGGRILGIVVNRVRLTQFPLYEGVYGLNVQPYIEAKPI